MTAEPASGGGYVLRGEAPWATSWGMAGVYAVAARLGPDQVVFVAVAGERSAGLDPSPPLQLVVMNASCTVRLGLRDLRVGPSEVITVLPLAEWRARDRIATAQPTPAAFGSAATCTRLLAERDAATAAALQQEVDECRAASYALADEGRSDDDGLREQVRLRAGSLELAVRCAHALVAATGGWAMELAHPAQRLLREAAFYAIQAQTADLRRSTLERLVRRRLAQA